MTRADPSATRSSKPAPVPSAETVPYHEAANRGQLLVRRCVVCGHHQAPDLPTCIRCAGDTDWVTSSGRGTIISFVTYRRSYHPDFAADVPYVVALIELDEGVRMISNILGRSWEEVRCDLRVKVEFERRGDRSIPQFSVVEPETGR